VFGRASKPYPTPFTVDTGAGVQLAWGFTYERDIELSPRIYAVSPSAEDTTPPRPYGKPGETGTLDNIDGTTTVPEGET
jgi:hypothetical protein